MVSARRDAPVFAHVESNIQADVQTVWAFISDIENWPDWNPDIRSAVLHGDLVPGSEFFWQAGPSSISSQLEQVEPPHVIAWSGSTMGIKAIHTWTFRESGGETIATTEESWDGLLPKLFRWPLRRMLRRSLNSGMQYLKVRAELAADAENSAIP